MSERLSAKDSAKRMKADLKAAFPTVRFSIRGSRGTAYGTYDVRWTDGPTKQRVEEVIRQYEGKGFDGMTDSTYYKFATTSTGEQSGIGYLFLERDHSDGAIARAIREVADYWGGVTAIPTVEDFRNGRLMSRHPRPDMAVNYHQDWQTLIYRAMEDRTTVTR